MRVFRPKLSLIFIALAGLTLLAGCVRIPPTRQLPYTIRTLYVPMIQNESYEIGLEEDLTQELQKQFLREGQLGIRNRRRADMMCQVVLKSWKERGEFFEEDRFPSTNRVEVEVEVFLYNPEDLKRDQPVHTWKEVLVDAQYSADPRRTIDVLDIDGRKQVLEQVAAEIMAAVLYTESEEEIERRERLVELEAEGGGDNEARGPQPPRVLPEG